MSRLRALSAFVGTFGCLVFFLVILNPLLENREAAKFTGRSLLFESRPAGKSRAQTGARIAELIKLSE
jgi:hypothetical protein